MKKKQLNPAELLKNPKLQESVKEVTALLLKELTSGTETSSTESAPQADDLAAPQPTATDILNAVHGMMLQTLLQAESDLATDAIDRPRDQAGDFDSPVAPQGSNDLTGLKDKILDLAAAGKSCHECVRIIKQMLNVDVSLEYVHQAMQSYQEHLTAWRTRSLQAFYPFVFSNYAAPLRKGINKRLRPKLAWHGEHTAMLVLSPLRPYLGCHYGCGSTREREPRKRIKPKPPYHMYLMKAEGPRAAPNSHAWYTSTAHNGQCAWRDKQLK